MTAVLVVICTALTAPSRPRGVLVCTPAGLPRLLQAIPPVLSAADVAVLYAVARRSQTWTR